MNVRIKQEISSLNIVEKRVFEKKKDILIKKGNNKCTATQLNEYFSHGYVSTF